MRCELREGVCVVAALGAWLLLWVGPARAQLGNVTALEDHGRMVIVRADSAALRFVLLRAELLRIDYLPGPASLLEPSLAVIRDTTEPVNVRLLVTDSTIEISTSALTVRCARNPLRLSYHAASGATILEETPAGGFRAIGPLREIRFRLHAEEHLYGTGERGTSLDHRQWSFQSYNTQVFGYESPQPTMNITVPLVLSSRGYGLFFDDPYPGWFDFGSQDPEVLSYTADGGELSCYIMVAPTIPQQLELYTWLTGRQPLPPRWALGYLQSRFGYRSEAEARDVVRQLREHRIPADAIILDLDWFQTMGDLAWDRSSWNDPFTMMQDFLAEGIKTIVITEPYVAEYSSTFDEAAAAGYLARDGSGAPYRLSNWWSCGCDAGLVDFSNPSARSWWWAKHPPFMGQTMAGLWTDLGEPERHPPEMIHEGGPAAGIHNVFNLLWAKLVFEGFAESRPDQRVFNLTRSGYAGIQRYGVVTWSGDVARSFGGLALQPLLMLGMGLSGLAYHNSDIGGFAFGPTTPELYVRWMQYGTLSPITRAHGSRYPTEPWAYGPEAEAIARDAIEFRYRILPYLYSLAWENHRTGMPLARPLFFLDPANPALANETGSYLLGDDLLVAPVTEEGARQKMVTVPPGTWIDYWTHERLHGPATATLPAPLERIPLLVRGGAILPMQGLMQHTGERPPDTLVLELYPEPGQTRTFTMYEDDGGTLAYERGEYALTELSQSFTGGSGGGALMLTVGASIGAYDGKPLRRHYRCTAFGIAAEPSSVLLNEAVLEPLPVPEKGEIREGTYCYDRTAQTLDVLFGASPESTYTLQAAGILPTGLGQDEEPLGGVHLNPVFPNPFNNATIISFRIPAPGHVRISLVDLLGCQVALILDQDLGAGAYRHSLDATLLATGVYFVRLQTSAGGSGSTTLIQKVLLVK